MDRHPIAGVHLIPISSILFHTNRPTNKKQYKYKGGEISNFKIWIKWWIEKKKCIAWNVCTNERMNEEIHSELQRSNNNVSCFVIKEICFYIDRK
jgi:hypothetical protein